MAGQGHPHAPRRGFVLMALLAVAAGCAGERPEEEATVQPAVPLWEQPRDRIMALRPVDLEAASTSVVWAVDTAYGAVLRLSPPADEFSLFGRGDGEPVQVVDPLRLAVAPQLGIFVYDGARDSVDLYAPGGQHLRGFDPGIRPAFLTATRDPYGLIVAGVDTTLTGGPRLLVLWRRLQEGPPDTLLGPRHGPEAVRAAEPASGDISLAGSDRGVWLWARAVPDTVWELRPRGERTAVAVEDDDDLLGILFDSSFAALWTVSRDSATIRYGGYQIREDAERGGETARFLGRRSTPLGFTPQTVIDGVTIGWLIDPAGPPRLAAWDLGAPARQE